MKKLLLLPLLTLLSVGNMPAYVKPTYNECATIGFITMMCMCRLSDQKYITNETFNKVFTDKNLLIVGTALGISMVINAYKSIKNKEANINTTEEIEKTKISQ